MNKGITLGSLAKKIKQTQNICQKLSILTKGKTLQPISMIFIIDYAISRLANDKKFRSYKIPFIAEELGYNNEQAFTFLAFKNELEHHFLST